MKIKAKNYYTFFLCVGVIMGVVAIVDFFAPFLPDFLSGFFIGAGVLLTLMSAFLLMNKSYIKKIDVGNNDERLIMIRSKSYEISYYITTSFALVASITFGCLGEEYLAICMTINFLILSYTVIAVIVKWILSKKI